jgi:hypothetical protein
MGIYVQVPSIHYKANWLVEKAKAQRIEQPTLYPEAPEGMTLVCVVENGPFDAAAIVYDKGEFLEFTRKSERRKRHWLWVPSAHHLVAEVLKYATLDGGK